MFDIRTHEERASDLGWIPGSLHCPAGLPDLTEIEVPVIACATGRRSAALTATVRERGIEALNLEGGLLAWSMEHPICRAPDPSSVGEPVDPETFRRRIRSCFVVEAVESGALEESAGSFDPVAWVEALFIDLERMPAREVRSRIDQLAAMAWRFGHRLEFIRDHVDEFYRLASRLPA